MDGSPATGAISTIIREILHCAFHDRLSENINTNVLISSTISFNPLRTSEWLAGSSVCLGVVEQHPRVTVIVDRIVDPDEAPVRRALDNEH